MITVTERHRLEELIDAHGTAIIEWAATRAGGDAPESWHASYREMQAYLDELTDYSICEPADSAGQLAG